MNDKLELEDILEIFYTKFLDEIVGKRKEIYNERLNNGGREAVEELLSRLNSVNNEFTRACPDFLNGDELLDLGDVAAFYKNSSCKKVYQKLSEQLYKDLVTDEEVPVEDLDLDSGDVAIFERTRNDCIYCLSLVSHNKKISTYISTQYKYLPQPAEDGTRRWDEFVPRETNVGSNIRIKEYNGYGTYDCEVLIWPRYATSFYINSRADGDRNPRFTQEELIRLKREWLLNDVSSKLASSDFETPRRVYTNGCDVGYDMQTDKSPYTLKVARKLFDIGLAEYVSNPSYLHDILKIEDTERATYDLSDAEQVLLSTTQRLDTIYETRKKEEAQETVQLEKEEKEETKEQEPLFQFQEEKLPLAIQALYNAKVNGIELSESQERTLQIYEKLNSEKFREFKAQAQERARKQEERRKAVREENARKEEWLNSADNPINMRLAELKKTRNQVTALEGIKDAGLIVPDQEQKLDNLSEFLEMFEKTSQEQHEVDTGMSDESRAWYQEHYRAK